MNYDVNRLLDLKYLTDVINLLKNELNKLKNKKYKEYQIHNFKSMGIIEIKSLFNEYNISSSSLIKYINSDFIDHSWEFADLYSDDIFSSIEQKRALLDNALLEIAQLNRAIKIRKEIDNQKISLMGEMVKDIQKLIKILDDNYIVVNKDIIWLSSFISSLDCSVSEKYKFSSEITRYLINKNKLLKEKENKKSVQQFEAILEDVYSSDDIEKETYSKIIVDYYNKYKSLFDVVSLGTNIEGVLELSSSLVDEVKEINSLDDFCIKFAALLDKLHKANISNDLELAKNIQFELTKLDNLYNEINNMINSMRTEIYGLLDELKQLDLNLPASTFKENSIAKLNSFLEELSSGFVVSLVIDKINVECNIISQTINQIDILINLNDKISNLLYSSTEIKSGHTDDYYLNLSKLQSEVVSAINLVAQNNLDVTSLQLCDDLFEEFKLYEPNVVDDNENTDGNVKLKGFVLFDFAEKNKPYVLDDLNIKSKNNLIDSSIESNKFKRGYEDYSNLVNDLLLLGKPRVLLDDTSTFADKFMGEVYYNVSKKISTGMKRIRPTRNSIVRFVSKKVNLIPGTEIYDQITNLLLEIIPNIQIDVTKNFAIFINFASAFKREDESFYNISINRFNAHSILYKLLIENPSKVKLNNNELTLIKEIILMTLNTYYELEKENNLLDFSIITKMGGKKTHGQ